jgi:cytochrome P450
LAGEDTTANTLAWAIDYLVDKPALQDEMYAEIQANYPAATAEESGALNYDDLDKFPLSFAAAQESMRLKPVAPYLYLEGYQDEVIEGYEIPKGTMLVALLSNEGFNAGLFPEPQAFKPQRWLNLSAETRKQYAAELMPFGFGARLCPGRQLSFVEMKLTLIELLRRYKFSRRPGYGPTKEIFAFTMVPDNLVVDVFPR